MRQKKENKKDFNWKNKKVLVTGSEGMIGKELVEQLKKLEADVYKFDIKEHDDWIGDITEKFDLEEVYNIDGPFDYVFHLFGIKGNPRKTKEKPVDFMYPMLVGDANSIYLAQKHKVKRFLYTSSIAVENPESDYYPAWAKSTAEKLIEAMRIQYPKGTKYCIVRPANVYGRYDDFNNPDAMVVTKLIKEAIKTKKIILDKKGSEQERDIINAKDVARGMIKAMEEIPDKPVNLCSSKGVKIDIIAHKIAQVLNIEVDYKDLNLVLGPDKKVMKNPYIKPQIKLEDGIREIINDINRKD